MQTDKCIAGSRAGLRRIALCLYPESMSLVTLDNISLAFGHVSLFEHTTFRIDRGERVSVVGSNGAGKSTLLRVVSGEQAPDAGTVTKEPGVRVARLEQDVPVITDRTVFDMVAEGLGE